jgi:hypothetical protein
LPVDSVVDLPGAKPRLALAENLLNLGKFHAYKGLQHTVILARGPALL